MVNQPALPTIDSMVKPIGDPAVAALLFPSAGSPSSLQETRLGALAAIQELIAARKALLLNLYGDLPYSKELERQYTSTLKSQDRQWVQLSQQRRIYPPDAKLYAALAEHIDANLASIRRYGSLKQLLQRCSQAQGLTQKVLIRELNKRLNGVDCFTAQEIPPPVAAASRLLQGLEKLRVSPEGNRTPEVALVAQAAHPQQSDKFASAKEQLLKENLLQNLRELAEARIGIKERAKQIMDLRAQWQKLCANEQVHCQQMEAQFNEAVTEAYEPCREYYQALTEKLASNLSKRQALAADMRDYFKNTNWEEVEWRSVELTLNAVRKQWASHAPTERQQTKPVKQQFQDYCGRVETLLEQEYNRNKAKAEQLIQFLESFVDQNNKDDVVSVIQALRGRWAALGVLRKADSAELHTRFEAQKSALIRQRKAFLEEQQQRRMRIRQAESMIEQLYSAGQLNGDELIARRDDVGALVDQFVLLSKELPGPEGEHPLIKQFKREHASYIDKVERCQQERRLMALEAFQEASRLISNAELGFVTRTSPEKLKVAFDMAGDYIRSVKYLPRHGEALLLARLKFIQAAQETR